MHVAYDLESFPNIFTCYMHEIFGEREWVYEISEHRNDLPYLKYDVRNGSIDRMYGFNSMTFDYPLLHYLLMIIPDNEPCHSCTARLWEETQRLINVDWNQRWQNHIWPRDQFVPQIDLLMVNHFDNLAKLTSLKDLEFNLQMPDVAEMPFEIGQPIRVDDIPKLIRYNANDSLTTKRFALECMDAIKFREGLVKDGTFGPECLNWNDVKIGEQFFIQRLERAQPGITAKVNGHRPQTIRHQINVGDVILPYISFERPELKDVLAKLRDTKVMGDEIKGSYNYRVMLEGVEISIGAGGIHGSLDRHVAKSTTDRVIIDIDVTGYYPSVAIVNRFYPAHIGPIFCDVYDDIKTERDVAKKDPAQFVKAGTLKLSNNGAFGKTGEKHSVLRDSQCLLSITINGQLLQCMLAEALLRVPDLRLLQLNTDGLTVDMPRRMRELFDDVCNWWQRFTCLTLEFKEYETLWLRDVNNYLARDTKGGMKRKGAYDWEMVSSSIGGQKAWNKDFSGLVIAKAAEAAFADDHDPEDFIAHHRQPYDFLMRKRVKGQHRLELGHSSTKLGKLVRYYIAKSGEPLVKIMPPLAGKTEWRRQGIHAEGQAHAIGTRKNYHCNMCNERFTVLSAFEDHNRSVHAWPIRIKNTWDGNLDDIDHRWYVGEAEKLLF